MPGTGAAPWGCPSAPRALSGLAGAAASSDVHRIMGLSVLYVGYYRNINASADNEMSTAAVGGSATRNLWMDSVLHATVEDGWRAVMLEDGMAP